MAQSGAHEPNRSKRIDSEAFYGEYHGHKVRHLEALLPLLRSSTDSLIWTAGDSSLDNKYWFHQRKEAVGAYAQVLDPPISVCDVTYWLNYLEQEQQDQQQQEGREGIERKYGAINTAVEATTLGARAYSLRAQDIFLRDNISSDDVLVVSVGGNDVALAPTPATILSLCGMLCLPLAAIEKGCTCCSVPVNDYCCGCGPSTLSCLGSCPPCLGYFRHLFGTRVQLYIEALTAKTKPRLVLVCMIYFPAEEVTPSWASPALGSLGYNTKPEMLQLFIRKAFEEATCRISIPGTTVIPVPLFEVLDGKRSEEYVARVEPSAMGGRRMAAFILSAIKSPSSSAGNTLYGTAPTTTLIADRNEGSKVA